MKYMPAPAESTDLELLALARNGQRDAYGQLVARHQTLVASLAYSICGDFRRSQDVAQEAFVLAWQQLGALEDATKFKSWLCGITRNLGQNLLRRQARRVDQPIDSALDPLDTAPNPRDQAVSREEAAIVWQSLERLPEIYREPLILFYREHQSVERVAAALELSEDTVRQRLARGRGMVREQVEKLVERSLGCTTPGVMFTTAVLSALPVVAVELAAGTTAVTAAKGGASAKTVFSLSWFGTALMPLVNIAGTYFISRQILPQARTPEERTFLRRLLWIMCAASCIAIIGVLGLQQWLMSEIAQEHLDFKLHRHHVNLSSDIQTFALLSFGLLCLFLAVTAIISLWGYRRYIDFARSFRLPENAAPWRKRIWFGPDRALAWRSKLTALGLPLIDIRFGHSPQAALTRGTARGWIALGDIAHGVLFALGGFALGGIAVGGVAIGVLSTGGVAIGAIALGGLAVGGVANGMVAIGYMALSALFALGYETASGFIAIARHFADGTVVTVGEHINDVTVRNWMGTSPVMRALKATEHLRMFSPAILIPVLSTVATNFLVRYRRTAP